MPDKRYRVFIDKESLDKPPEHSADIFQYNIFDRCIYEPHIFEIRKLGYTDALFLQNFYYITMFHQKVLSFKMNVNQ